MQFDTLYLRCASQPMSRTEPNRKRVMKKLKRRSVAVLVYSQLLSIVYTTVISCTRVHTHISILYHWCRNCGTTWLRGCVIMSSDVIRHHPWCMPMHL